MSPNRTVTNSERANLGDLSADSITQNFGDTYIQGEIRVPRFLTAPPFKPEGVLGRSDELNQIHQTLRADDRPLLLMNGEGGIGKTTLAACYWHNEQATYKHAAWLFVDGGIHSALLSLANTLSLTFDPQLSDEEQMARLLQRLASLDADCLLILDNANDPAELETCYLNLRKLPNCHVLLTTRVDEMAGAARLKIEPLLKPEAIRLFTHYCPVTAAETDTIHQILVAIGYNTLVIELLAKNLKNLNEFSPTYSLSNLLNDLQAKGLLHLQTQVVQTAYGSSRLRTAEPEAILRAMYDLNQLPPPAQWLLNNLAVLPAQGYPYALLEDLLTPAQAGQIQAGLRELRQKGWVDWNETEKTVKISPVVQAVARDKNKQTLLTDCATLVASLNTKFDSLNYTQVQQYLPLTRSVVGALSEANADVDKLVFRLADFLKETGNFSEAAALFNKLVARLNDSGNAVNLSVCWSRLGELYLAEGRFEQALDFFEKDLMYTKKLYEANPQLELLKEGLAISYQKLGELHQAQGHFEQSLDFFEKGLRLKEELIEANPQSEHLKNGLAICYSRLGVLHQAQGRFGKALYFFTKQFQLAEKLYETNPQSEQLKTGLAIGYSKLGELCHAIGHIEKSAYFFEKQFQLAEELHKANPSSVGLHNGLAISYWKLGSLAREIAENSQARLYFEQAEAIWTVLCEQVGIPEYCNNLAQIQRDLAGLD